MCCGVRMGAAGARELWRQTMVELERQLNYKRNKEKCEKGTNHG